MYFSGCAHICLYSFAILIFYVKICLEFGKSACLFGQVKTSEYRRKRPICENARYFLLFTTVYFFFFSSSFLFFSFLVLFLLVIYVHSRVSRSVVSGVHFFFASLYSYENTPESWIWPRWIHCTRVTAHAMSLMTGNGHIELLNVTRYNFQPSRAR